MTISLASDPDAARRSGSIDILSFCGKLLVERPRLSFRPESKCRPVPELPFSLLILANLIARTLAQLHMQTAASPRRQGRCFKMMIANVGERMGPR